eukprot:scaffold704_cov254-Pinguiococcus_pyrenoidosus.AAC.3
MDGALTLARRYAGQKAPVKPSTLVRNSQDVIFDQQIVPGLQRDFVLSIGVARRRHDAGGIATSIFSIVAVEAIGEYQRIGDAGLVSNRGCRNTYARDELPSRDASLELLSGNGHLYFVVAIIIHVAADDSTAFDARSRDRRILAQDRHGISNPKVRQALVSHRHFPSFLAILEAHTADAPSAWRRQQLGPDPLSVASDSH